MKGVNYTGLGSDLDAVIGEPRAVRYPAPDFQTKCTNTRTNPILCMVLGGLKQERKEIFGRENETTERQ